jgi:hypothetical protein
MTERRNAAAKDDLWVPDNPDGSGWAPVDWASAARGSRYHYRHAEPWEEANHARPACYRVVTRYESPEVEPHENSYYVAREALADFLAELTLAAGAETLWHVEPCAAPPRESRVRTGAEGGTGATA